MAKKTIFIFILFVFCFANTTCRKKLSTPVNLFGIWVADGQLCQAMFLEIKKNGASTYGTDDQNKGCSGKSWSGKYRMNSFQLYIGKTTFNIIEQPILIDTPDSAGWGNKRGRIVAEMTLKSSVFHRKETLTFHKTVNF
ncbi:MAG: hypothetical protein Q7W45_03460 [Bacteroidota bacterium]|nr:hypothetical protein [Bacteroidota bacterium]MDP3143861.1 hypothetical protein [Bacteroidota bacterium]